MQRDFVTSTLVAVLLSVGIPLHASASEQDIRNSIALGALAFSDVCARCHQVDGYDEEGLYPSLQRSELLQDKSRLIQTILDGRRRHSDHGDVELMPSLDFLTDAEIAAIIAFITNSWDGNVMVVTDQEVRDARSATSRE